MDAAQPTLDRAVCVRQTQAVIVVSQGLPARREAISAVVRAKNRLWRALRRAMMAGGGDAERAATRVGACGAVGTIGGWRSMTRDSEVFTPGSAAKRLGIGGSTLRIYSVKLADVLSPSAGQPRRRVDGRPGPRLYSKKDLDVLERAKGLLARGLTYDEVALELAGRGNGEARVRGSVKQAARSEWTRTLEALNDALERAMAVIAAWQRLADGRERDVAELREKVELLEARLTEARRGGGWLRWLR